MSTTAVILRVRFKSALSLEEIKKVVEERAPEFRALRGLKQKYYVQDPASGDYGGIYLWESADALADYRDSDLRASIGKAYQTLGEPDIEVYQVLKALREEDV